MANPSRNYEVYLISSPDFWYVGSTTVGIRRRMWLHKNGHGSAKLLREQIERLGWDHFTVSILETGHGVPHLAEAAWYDQLRESETRQSLNVHRPGGYPKHTPETKAKLAEQKRGKPSPRKGIPVSEETRRAMRASSAQAAKTRCAKGHAYDAENTRVRPNGTRVCRACSRAYFVNRDPAAKAAKMRRDVAARKQRYNVDPDYRARVLAYNQANAKAQHE